MPIEQNIARIRAFRLAEGLSIRKLAEKASLRESTIRNLDDADWNPTAETIKALEAVVPVRFKAPV